MTAPVAIESQPNRRAVGIWLLVVAVIILAMVAVGGLTRLTGSGLSITQWDPIMGALPPLSDGAWQHAFAQYKLIPQYRLENAGMTLEGFKAIFWWEWAHRLLGRLLGFAFFVPFVWFAWTGAIKRQDWPRMLLLFALGGLQGFVGWWMVESGLETRVSVSQYRLAIHLGVAIVLLGAMLWVALEYLRPKDGKAPARHAKWGVAFVGLVYLQMLLGALVSGLHAGRVYNSWPLMDGLTPAKAFFYSPWWINFFESTGLVQFDHRIGAYLVACGAFSLWSWGRRASLAGFAKYSSNALLLVTAAQVYLGIETLLWQAPITLAALHQVVAALLFCAAIWHAYELRYTVPNP